MFPAGASDRGKDRSAFFVIKRPRCVRSPAAWPRPLTDRGALKHRGRLQPPLGTSGGALNCRDSCPGPVSCPYPASALANCMR